MWSRSQRKTFSENKFYWSLTQLNSSVIMTVMISHVPLPEEFIDVCPICGDLVHPEVTGLPSCPSHGLVDVRPDVVVYHRWPSGTWEKVTPSENIPIGDLVEGEALLCVRKTGTEGLEDGFCPYCRAKLPSETVVGVATCGYCGAYSWSFLSPPTHFNCRSDIPPF